MEKTTHLVYDEGYIFLLGEVTETLEERRRSPVVSSFSLNWFDDASHYRHMITVNNAFYLH